MTRCHILFAPPRSTGDATWSAPWSRSIARVLLVSLVFSMLLPGARASGPNRALVAPGDLVPAFGADGVVKTDFAGGNDGAAAVATTPTGRIIAAGSAAVPGRGTDFALAGYDGQGRLDPTFGEGGKRTVDFFGADDGARGVAVQRDGRVVLSGFATNGSERQFALARFNPDGSPDTTFDQDGKVVFDLGSTSEAFKVGLQADDKIVAVGDSRPENSLEFTAVRLNPTDGSLDGSFGANGVARVDFGFTDRAIDLAIDDSNIFLVGFVVKSQTDSDFGIARLTISNGSLSGAFGGDGTVTLDFHGGRDGAQTIELRPPTSPVNEPHLIIGGFATPPNSNATDFALAAVNYQGSLLNTLFDQGKQTLDFKGSNDQVLRVLGQPDGDIVAVGWAGDGATFDLGIAKWNRNGRLELDWGSRGRYTRDVSSGANNVAFDAVFHGDTVVTAGQGLNPETGNDDFILTQHENEKFGEVVKRVQQSVVEKGEFVTYTFEVTNHTDEELSFIVNDLLPDGVTFDASQNTDWKDSGLGSTKLVGRDVAVPAGQTSFIALRVRADQPGVLKNSAALLLPYPNPHRPGDPEFFYRTPRFLGSSEVESHVR